ncbi:ExeA family protein [Oxalobacteraceae bacterium A2-2]
MYLTHFGLRESPFGITPNPAFFYPGNTRGELLEALLYVVGQGEGIIKVTGEVGSGKTMLCRMLEQRLPAHIDAIYLVNPSLSPQEVLYAIAAELGLAAGGLRSDEVLRLLNAELIARHGAGRQVVLLVEEAQAMPLATLEEIRLLTNLETARYKLLQIVLFGQPELDQHLALPDMRQLTERITHSFEVPAMPPAVVPEFLDFRLRAAGYQGPPAFSTAAARLIARASGGIVRRINLLADKALLAAYAAGAERVEARHARQAVREARYRALRPPRHQGGRWLTVMLAALVLLLAGVVAWLLLQPAPQQTGPQDGRRTAVVNRAESPPERAFQACNLAATRIL